MMRITILLLAVALSSTFATKKTPSNDCGKEMCIHRDLESTGFKVYLEIEDAAYIPPSKFTPEATLGTCGTATNRYYGTDPVRPIVWVDKGCKGHFKICYIPGICEDYTLSPRRPNITFHDSCMVYSMECKRRHTDASQCDPATDFTNPKNEAKTYHGCDCDFTICRDVKDTIPAEDTTTIPAAAPANTPMGPQPHDLEEYNVKTERQNTNGDSNTVSGSHNNNHNGHTPP